MDTLEIEIAIVEQEYNSENTTHNPKLLHLLNLLQKGNYEEIINDALECKALTCCVEKPDDVTQVIRDFLGSLPDDDLYERELQLLLYAIASLKIFVQNNWCGPPKDEINSVFFSSCEADIIKKQDLFNKLLEANRVDGEAVYTLTRYYPALLLAKLILLECRNMFKYCKSVDWWALRSVYLHQSLLDERSSTLKSLSLHLMNSVEKDFLKLIPESNRSVYVQFYVEASHMNHFYFEYKSAKMYLDKAEEAAALKITLQGLMGRRTKFQETSYSILRANITRIENKTSKRCNATQNQFPKNVALNHEYLLESPVYDNDPSQMAEIFDFESALILNIGLNCKWSQGCSKLADEELLVYLDGVLGQPKNWNVQSHALFQRSKIEREQVKKLERQMTQMEELVKQFSSEGNIMPRTHLTVASQVPPHWKIEHELAHILIKFGSMKTALEIFIKLQRWGSVIECYQALGRSQKAEELVREQMAIRENPELWCYLGDVTHDCQHYAKAWEMSNNRYSRAQKMWGYTLYNSSKYSECLQHFEKALAINPLLDKNVWFSYGCACMQSEEYIKGANAFRRFLGLEYDSFQAWNNLAACLLRSHEKIAAFKAFKEASRCSYENWRIWENVLVTGADVGQFGECITAYHRLLDLERKQSDVEVLKILVKAVKTDIPDFNDEPSGKFREKLLELFGRITSKVTSESEIWSLYAELSDEGPNSDFKNREKVALLQQKAVKAMTYGDYWLEDVDNCKKVTAAVSKLEEAMLELCRHPDQNTRIIQLITSCKLSINGHISKLQKKYTNVEGTLIDSVVEHSYALQASYDSLVQKLSELQAS